MPSHNGSLYTNIPNSEGIAATKKTLDKETNKTIATKVITTFLANTLTLNNFIFNWKNYLKTKGCTVGTICAPSDVNIFLAEFECKYIHPSIKNISTLFLQFTDNIVMMWKRTHVQLQNFLKKLDEQFPTIKFLGHLPCY